jgi:hypothetical protein
MRLLLISSISIPVLAAALASSAATHMYIYSFDSSFYSSSMVLCSMAISVVVVVLQEEVLVSAVGGECNGRDAKAREGSSETIPPGERPLVSPCFPTTNCQQRTHRQWIHSSITNALSQGSYLGWPAAALILRMSNPVMFGFSPWTARSILEE